ncbi:MAG: argininosuccinate lyase, partial [Spartobacteria bacterium]|nr:argininosuccinate lyase [Spartobacteria bacterium]
MAKAKQKQQTTVGQIDAEVLAYTAGRDAELDRALIEADCLGSAAHVTMLSRIPVQPPLFSASECKAVIAELVAILKEARNGAFKITVRDQDVHLAVERTLTRKLGVLGKRIHTGRSRNDQVAVDLRLYARTQLIDAVREAADLADSLVKFARRHADIPMVGRTHLQPAMPSSVALWATAHAESLLEDVMMLINAYELNDQCPLGAAASYGVPLPLDREMTAALLGFSRPCQNVLYAVTARGKMESIILSALSQVMLTLSRLAEDMILYSMPEFGYFTLPKEYCTGSSIMPQKNNPDVPELVRARASRVLADMMAVFSVVKSLPSGYNRDVQETKEPLMTGMDTTRASLRIMGRLTQGLKANRKNLCAAFTPEVFATDRAIELVAGGMPFRDA